jgi:putative transposase
MREAGSQQGVLKSLFLRVVIVVPSLRQMVDRGHSRLPLVRRCALLGVSSSSLNYRPKGDSQGDLCLMREMDRQYLETTFYGSRRMRAWLDWQGIRVYR